GIERHYSLSKLRFTPQQKEDGSYVIKVSSPNAIREPFLNFLIDVHWPQGRLLREFTVLLDPPSSFEGTADAAELPETESYAQQYEQPRQRRPSAEPLRERPRRRQTPVDAAASAAPAEPVAVTGNQYGPVSRNETLWSIAQQFNQDASISQSKMMAALHKANPRAFYKNNINALKAGETLLIPDRESIVRLTGETLAPPSPRRTQNLTPKEETSSEQIGGEPTDGAAQLKILPPAVGKSKPGDIAGSGKPGDASPEVADSVRQENEEIRKRLADFEKQLSGMQKLLTLKDEQIAALQTASQAKQPPQTAQPPAAAAQQPTIPAAPRPQTPAQGISPPTSLPTSIPATPTTQPAIPPTPGLEFKPPQQTPAAGLPIAHPPTIPAEQPKPETPVVKPVVQPPPAIKPPQQATKPTAATPAAEEKGIVDDLFGGEPSYLIGGATGLLLLTLATAVWLKRRRAAMIDDTESILTLSDREKTLQAKRTPVPLDAPSSISEQSTTARSSFLSEFTPSDFDALGGEMEEVDPISEADVYLAYGRYKQAEELIRSAIGQNPERDECKLKLLEIHYATENAQAFERFAEELATTHKDAKPEFWEKVVEMGQELCPGSPLFGNEASDSRAKQPSIAAATNDANEDDIDGYSYPAAPTLASSSQQQGVTLRETKTTPAYDFFAADATDLKGQKDSSEDSDLTQLSNVLSFEKTTLGTNGVADLQDKSLDDILAELGVLSGSPSTTHETENTLDENDVNGLKFEPLRNESRIGNVDEVGGDPDYLALSDMDEQETKLDLAKAYFDMGDNESARSILEGVAQQGNNAQKEEAWSLLKNLTRKEANRR
ncbi:MAG: FimV/HubP family polar landmark protein, partial [Candidatus Methylumidiphilus sp.]